MKGGAKYEHLASARAMFLQCADAMQVELHTSTPEAAINKVLNGRKCVFSLCIACGSRLNLFLQQEVNAGSPAARR